ncbi:hypothetical protein H8959_019590 [Pygathrix nigripes]
MLLLRGLEQQQQQQQGSSLIQLCGRISGVWVALQTAPLVKGSSLKAVVLSPAGDGPPSMLEEMLVWAEVPWKFSIPLEELRGKDGSFGMDTQRRLQYREGPEMLCSSQDAQLQDVRCLQTTEQPRGGHPTALGLNARAQTGSPLGS